MSMLSRRPRWLVVIGGRCGAACEAASYKRSMLLLQLPRRCTAQLPSAAGRRGASPRPSLSGRGWPGLARVEGRDLSRGGGYGGPTLTPEAHAPPRPEAEAVHCWVVPVLPPRAGSRQDAPPHQHQSASPVLRAQHACLWQERSDDIGDGSGDDSDGSRDGGDGARDGGGCAQEYSTGVAAVRALAAQGAERMENIASADRVWQRRRKEHLVLLGGATAARPDFSEQ